MIIMEQEARKIIKKSMKQMKILKRSMHSHKILTKQQGKPCYVATWCKPCSDQERCQAGRASLSCSDTESSLGEYIKVVY